MKASLSRRGLFFAWSGVKDRQTLFCLTHSISKRPSCRRPAHPGLHIHVGNFSSGTGRVSSITSPAIRKKAWYNLVGRSGLRVSMPILGTINFGDKRWAEGVLEEEEALPLLKEAFDCGINTWDTSGMYSNGESERIIAKAIQRFKIPRHKLIICTRCGDGLTRENNEPGTLNLLDAIRTVDYVNHYGLSRQAIINAVAASMARLETDYIDLLQIGGFDSVVPIEETMEVLHDLVKSGKVRYIGASWMHAYQFASMQFCAEKHGWTKFISMTNFYTPTYREEEREMIPFCKYSGVGLLQVSRQWGIYSAYQRAPNFWRRSQMIPTDFPDLYQRKGTKKVCDTIQAIADRRGWTTAHVVLAWLRARDMASFIIAFNRVDAIHDVLDSRDKWITDEEISEISDAYTQQPFVPYRA